MKIDILGNESLGLTDESVRQPLTQLLYPVRQRIGRVRICFSRGLHQGSWSALGLMTLRIDNRAVVIQAGSEDPERLVDALSLHLANRMGLPRPRRTERLALVG